MRNLYLLDQFRVTKDLPPHWRGFTGDETCGAFLIPSKIDRAPMKVIASSEGNWDHVSVSRKNRTPNWSEMCQIKTLFFEDHEAVMQLHVPEAEHVNNHPYCLHLWRPQKQEIPRPPGIFVGIAGIEGKPDDGLIEKAIDEFWAQKG